MVSDVVERPCIRAIKFRTYALTERQEYGGAKMMG